MRVLWRPSKRCTWFVFRPPNLLSLDTASSSYLISALWDIKYTLILKKTSSGMVRWGGETALWAIWKIDLLGFGSRVWTVKGVLNKTESHTVYIATIMGSINTHHLNKSILDSVQVFLREGSKELWHQSFLTWFLSLLHTVSKHIIWSDGWFRCGNPHEPEFPSVPQSGWSTFRFLRLCKRRWLEVFR